MSENKQNKNTIKKFILAVAVILTASVVAGAGGAYVALKKAEIINEQQSCDIKENKALIYKQNQDCQSMFQVLNDKKASKREIDNLKEYMGIQFNDIKKVLYRIENN